VFRNTLEKSIKEPDRTRQIFFYSDLPLVAVVLAMSPPIPAPLGERRGFNFLAQMPQSQYTNSSGDSAGPALSNLPRRKTKARKPPVPFTKEITVQQVEQPIPRDRCWSEVVPSIFVAFHGEGDQKIAIVEGGKRYTHVVTISLGHQPGIQETTSEFSDGSCVRALHLFIPHPKTTLMRVWRTGLGLSTEQLAAATIFMEDAFASTPNPRVLVTCPFDSQTDAMGVILTYLSKSLQEDVAEIMKVIDMIDDLRSAWKGEVNEEEIDVIRSVLKDNSWLLEPAL